MQKYLACSSLFPVYMGNESHGRQPEGSINGVSRKLYLPETESDVVDAFLRSRLDLMISELSITEVISAVARRRREGVLGVKHASQIRNALLKDAGFFRRLDLSPAIHREAERMLLSTGTVPLRTLDALHIAMAVAGEAKSILTFDRGLAEAAALHGLEIIQLQ